MSLKPDEIKSNQNTEKKIIKEVELNLDTVLHPTKIIDQQSSYVNNRYNNEIPIMVDLKTESVATKPRGRPKASLKKVSEKLDLKINFSDSVSKNEKKIINEVELKQETKEQNNKYSKSINNLKYNQLFLNIKSKLNNIWTSIKPLINLENGIFLLIILLSVRLRLVFFPFESVDYTGFLKNWTQYIVDNGGFNAFRDRFYDYTPAYLYYIWIGTLLKANPLFWIKGLSVVFDFVMAYYVAKIVQLKSPQLFKTAFAITLLLPSVIFNGSWWGQCDTIYGSLVLGCLYYIMTNKIIKSVFCFCIALCLKLQTVFFAPIILILILTKNLSKKVLIAIPFIFICLYMVMILPISPNFVFYDTDVVPENKAKYRPLLDTKTYVKDGVETAADFREGLLTIYLNQSKSYSNLVMGPVPSMYQWIAGDKYQYFYEGGIILVSLILLLLAYYIVHNKVIDLNNDLIIKLSMLVTVLVPFLLPKMHERYFFLAEIMALVYSMWFPKRFWVGILMSLISFSIYIASTIGFGELPKILHKEYNSVWILFLLIYLFYDLIISFKKSKSVLKTDTLDLQ